jgi:hypothetical protein
VLDRPSDARCSTQVSSSVLARHSDGGIPKPTKSLLRRGFLKPPVAMGPKKEVSGTALPPLVPGALDFGSGSGFRVGFLGFWRF